MGELYACNIVTGEKTDIAASTVRMDLPDAKGRYLEIRPTTMGVEIRLGDPASHVLMVKPIVSNVVQVLSVQEKRSKNPLDG